LIVAITSDRGLCGAVHTNVAKTIRNELSLEAPDAGTKVFCVGDKSRALLQRYKYIKTHLSVTIFFMHY
jgi:F-type H+-transporting ATPase subunit gamma